MQKVIKKTVHSVSFTYYFSQSGHTTENGQSMKCDHTSNNMINWVFLWVACRLLQATAGNFIVSLNTFIISH